VARVAECAGASGLVIPERRAAQVTPVVCKTSAGAVEHLPIAQVRNISDYLEAAKDQQTWVYGADATGQPYGQFDYSGRTILVLGAEGRGLRPRVAKTCDALVALPIRGHVDSLNVSAAAAALVYGILHSVGSG
jgi:23S rRNA (guanosine2251-2'-O)-methyltransferase